MLYWIRTNFLDPTYYTTSYNTLCTPLHLDLLREVCATHALQRHAVLDILVKSFEMEPELEALAAVCEKREREIYIYPYELSAGFEEDASG